MSRELTQHEKIITIMARQPGHWFRPADFMQPELGELFVGYEASARLSELAKQFPRAINSRQSGKYIERCLIGSEGLDKNLARIVNAEVPVEEPVRQPEPIKLFDLPAKRRPLI